MSNGASSELAAERLARIRDLLRRQTVVRVEEIQRLLKVSAATVRRDLGDLAAQGCLRRVHGGAMAVEGRLDEPVFDDKTSLRASEKQAIAERALAFVNDADCIYLDGGSTVLALARLLAARPKLTVVTNSLRVAMTLAAGGPRLILVGGELRRLSQTFVGPLSESVLSRLHLDKAFMGTIGLTVEGLTTTDPNEAFTKRLVLTHAEKVFLLADGSKLGKVAFANSGSVDDLDVLITDQGADEALCRQFRKREVDVIKV